MTALTDLAAEMRAEADMAYSGPNRPVLERWATRLDALARANTVAVDRGALQAAINMLRRDAAEGKAARGELADLLTNGTAPPLTPTGAKS